SLLVICIIFVENVWRCCSVSFICYTITLETTANAEALQNMVSIPCRKAMYLPISGPMAPPKQKHNPCIPKASAHRFDGLISAMYAEVAVGLNPVEKPCTRRRIKNPAKELKIGYKKPHNTQTIEPLAMTGTRPH